MMADNPRPTLSTSPKPTMIFPNIPGATLYQFTMGNSMRADNPRPTLSTSPEPTMIFPNIPGATLYQFKMIKPDGETLWEKEVNSSDPEVMDTNDGYYKYDYPYPQFPLERIGTYVITGETTDGKSDFRGEAEVLLLDDNTIQAILALQSEIDLDNQPPSPLAEKYLEAITKILVCKPASIPSPLIPWGIGCKVIPLQPI